MSNYDYVALKNLCTVNQGLQIPIKKRFKSSGKNRYFYITVQFLKDNQTEQYYIENPPLSSICTEEDIIVVRTGSTGQILTGISGCFHNNFFKVNYDKNKVFGRYLYYCLSSKEKQKEMKQRAGITVIPDLNHFMFLDMKIPLPSYQNQLKIASLLDVINKKIEINNKINQQLEEMAKTIYDYWFVQFDFPNENGKPYKSSGGEMVYNKELKREIPKGWEVGKLEDIVAKIGTGLNPRKNFKLGKGNNYYVTIKNIRQGEIILDNKCDKIDDEALEIINKRSDLQVGDILFTSIEPIGTTYLIKNKPVNWNINESVFTIRPNYEKVTSDFLYMFLSSDYVKVFTKNSSTGSIHKGIRHNTLKRCNIIIPPKIFIQIFSNKVGVILKKIDLYKQENQKLAEIRDFLLPMLMNGQITVKS